MGRQQADRSLAAPPRVDGGAGLRLHRARHVERPALLPLLCADGAPLALALPDALFSNASVTPAGPIDDGARVAGWQRARESLLARLTAHGLACRDYTECRGGRYAGAAGRQNAAYQEVRRPVGEADRTAAAPAASDCVRACRAALVVCPW